jgi:hypothetical protein
MYIFISKNEFIYFIFIQNIQFSYSSMLILFYFPLF